MSTAATCHTEERAELETILQSGIFNRAPNLVSFLKYVCDKYFQGQADSIKEYSIAVEALRRPPDFDQRKDSIVRVEAHRLRKRLAEYYEAAGADHKIQLVIPNGQYAPCFIYADAKPENNAVALAEPAVEPVPPPSVNLPATAVPPLARSTFPLSPRSSLLLAAAVVLLSVAFVAGRVHTSASASAGENWQGSYVEPAPNEFRFLPGYRGRPFTDRQGRIWQPDAYFQGGVSIRIPADVPIDGLPDPQFVKSRREGSFTYAIPERQGTYEVHLHFIGLEPTDMSDPSSAPMFQVSVNNKTVLGSFDPVSEAGGFGRFHSRVIHDVQPANDGKIHLGFQPVTNKAFVSAIEILRSLPGKARPVRIVAAKSSVIDSTGRVWVADEDAVGGFLVERRDSISNQELQVLFAGEHYGNFAYHIPMPPGFYRVKLYFAETYFGSHLPSATPAPGARLFNVYANGLALLREFDVAKTAGGPNRATVKEFDNIEPNAQGNIVLEFVPVRNYAEVNAIEVSQMDRATGG